MTWTHGRQLASLKKNLSSGVVNTVSYSYNSDGVRIGKVVNGTTVEYVLNGTQIVAEKNGDHIIRYVYDAQGLPVAMILDGTTYLYEKNIFGDVIGIYNTSGTKVVVYKYSAWGVLMDSTCVSGYEDVRSLNPFRYRGYYFDTETAFYYLQSRYYDPRTGRFLNADHFDVILATPEGLTDKNLYAYCDNNPIMREDGDGEFWDWVAIAVVNVAVNVVITATAKLSTGQNYTWGDFGIAVAAGIANSIHPVLGVFVSGLCTTVSARAEGASWGDAFLVGTISASATYLSISNLANIIVPESVTLGINVALDLTFGTGYSILSEV